MFVHIRHWILRGKSSRALLFFSLIITSIALPPGMTRCGGTIFDRQLWTRQLSIVDPPIVDPPIMDLPIVDPPIVDPPIDPLHYMKFGYSRASATALVRTRVCSGTQFSQVNSQKIRYFDISSRPKTATFLGFVLPQTFLTFRRRVFSPTLRNLAAATPWKISVKGFPRRVKRTFLKPVFHRWQGRKK